MNNAISERLLHDHWRFRELQAPDTSPDLALKWLPAVVPGDVCCDLVRVGVLTDPFKQMHERSAEWIGRTDWVYETHFHLAEKPANAALLRFEGLDTIAEIALNGQLVGRADNMMIAHEFSAGGHLRFGEGEAGDNSLQVTFRSPVRVGIERRAEWYATSGETMQSSYARFGPRSFVRKAQYMFGWDWGPMILTCGMWRPVKLIQVPVARLLDWSYSVAFQDDGTADVTVTQFVERTSGHESTPLTVGFSWPEASRMEETIYTRLPGRKEVAVPHGEGRIPVTAVVQIAEPELWWPNRHNPEGECIHPVLYTLERTLLQETTGSGAADVLDSSISRIGLRTVELVRDPDSDGAGEGFKFRVNGHDLFARGANWIPSDSLPSRLENEPGRTVDGPDDGDARVYNLICEICEAGYNMLRVWGGGVYESEHFYELCDEHGILVWQDFLYACAYYPDTGQYAEAARQEAIAAVRRLRIHPSLCIWCGNNENDAMYAENWGKLERSRYHGENLYHEVLPRVVCEEDGERPYWPSSPYGGPEPNSQDFGDRHNWAVWHGVGDWINYRTDRSRFVSEFGFASSCSLSAWETCLDEDDWSSPYSPNVRWHDKTRKGYDVYLGMVALHYPAPQTLEDLVYYSQLNQADALSFGVEHYRRLKGRCWGTLFWQVNDCWPTQSWAVIDSVLEPKAAFYASRRFYAPVLLSLERDGETVRVHVVNDRLGEVTGTVTVQIKTFTGEILDELAEDVVIAKNEAAKVAEISLAVVGENWRKAFVSASFCESHDRDLVRAQLLLAEPKDLELPDPGLRTTIGDEDAEHLHIKLETQAFAAAVWLSVDAGSETPPEFSDNFFHLEPGESRTILATKCDLVPDAVALQELLKIRTLAG